MEIRWVDRDKDGKICGTYACLQRDGQESLSEDHPAMLEFVAVSKAEREAFEAVASAKEDLVASLKSRLDAAEEKLVLLDKEIKTLKDAKP